MILATCIIAKKQKNVASLYVKNLINECNLRVRHAHAAVIDFNYVIFYVIYTTTLITVNISRGGGGGGARFFGNS